MKKPLQVTLKDLAKELNLSPSTVSRALNNHPDISQDTIAKVQELAQRLEYNPNTLAMNLRRQKSNAIGVIVPEIINHFFSTVLSGIDEAAHRAGYRVMMCQSNDSYEREKENIETLMSSRVDGLLISIAQQTTDFEHFKRLERQGLPFVFYDRIAPDLHANMVQMDDYNGAFATVEHLIQNGAKRIAYLAGNLRMSISRERERGYVSALQRYDLPVSESLIIRDVFSIEDGFNSAAKLMALPEPPDAIFGVNDRVTLGALRKLQQININVPEDVSLAGFNDDPLMGAVVPAITTFSQPGYAIGKKAAEILIEQIEHPGDASERQKVILNGELIVRDTSIKTPRPLFEKTKI